MPSDSPPDEKASAPTTSEPKELSASYLSVLESIGRVLGLERLEPDEDGVVCLRFDEVEMYLEWRERPAGLSLFCVLGDFPEVLRQKVYAELLDGHVYFRDTNGAALGVPAGTDTVTLQHLIPEAACNIGFLESAIEDFVNVAESFQERLEALESQDSEEMADADSADATPPLEKLV